jgi:hypothetical protein
MNKKRYSLKVVWCLFLILLVCGCVGRRPDDDVALIKQLLSRFERGISQTSAVILDSVILGERQNTSSGLLDSLCLGEKLESARIAEKGFVILGDSAEVKLRLSLGYATQAEEPEQIEKPLKLFLRKTKGKWKIQGFSMASNERQ